ncbi:MAG TPA: hypothetical protein VGB55_15010 [Tepidisphaeraceae bacterium]
MTGCTSYRYEAQVPPEAPMAVVKKVDLVLPAGPVELRFRQVESRCVLLVTNRQSEPVQIDGNASALVDPKGQSHPVAGQLIPPDSHVKFVLPPLRDVNPRGPAFQIGFGVLVNADLPDSQSPREALYLSSAASGDGYWEWSGSGEIRLTLALVHQEQRTTHHILIRRIKN